MIENMQTVPRGEVPAGLCRKREVRRALLQVDAEEVERGLNVKRGALDEDGLVDLVAAVVLRPDGVAGLVAHAEKDHGHTTFMA